MKTTIAAAVGLCLLAGPVSAENLYDPAEPGSLVADSRAHRVGDLLTVLLVETTTAESRADTTEDASWELQGGVKDASGLTTGALNLGSESNGEGRTARSGRLRGQISVRVEEVLGADTFRVRGEQLLTINGEQQRIRIDGIARAIDIGSDNSIPSSRLANATIEYDGDGWVARSQKAGWLRRLFVFLGF